MKFNQIIVCMACFLAMRACTSDQWITLFDGETFQGWQPSEDPASWKIEDGAIVASGGRSHLFYAGDVLEVS